MKNLLTIHVLEKFSHLGGDLLRIQNIMDESVSLANGWRDTDAWKRRLNDDAASVVTSTPRTQMIKMQGGFVAFGSPQRSAGGFDILIIFN